MEKMKFSPDVLFERRSIRRFASDFTVPESQIRFLLDAAMCAPSARNRQPWHFVVVNDQALSTKISIMHPYAKMLPEASLAIAVCGDSRLETEESYLIQACAAATQNILLAATAAGLGSVWLGIHPRPERVYAMREVLGLPLAIFPVSLVAIGCPNEEKPRNANYRHSRVHVNGWVEKPTDI